MKNNISKKSLLPTVSILGSGWLGAPLAQHLHKCGYPLKVSSRNPQQRHINNTILSYCVDIDREQWSAEFFSAEILICAIPSKNIHAFIALNKMIEHAPIQKVLFISSTGVYRPSDKMIDEAGQHEDLHHPLYQIEQGLRNSPHFTTTVIRFAGLIGPRRHPGRFFQHQRPIPQPNSPVNLIHLSDCIGLITHILGQQHAIGEVYNGCADSHPSRYDFYHHARQQLQQPPPIFSQHCIEKPAKYISNDKIKTQLGYQLIFPDLMAIPLNAMSN